MKITHLDPPPGILSFRVPLLCSRITVGDIAILNKPPITTIEVQRGDSTDHICPEHMLTIRFDDEGVTVTDWKDDNREALRM